MNIRVSVCLVKKIYIVFDFNGVPFVIHIPAYVALLFHDIINKCCCECYTFTLI